MAEVWPALGQATHRGQGELGGVGLRSKGARPHARKCVSGHCPVPSAPRVKESLPCSVRFGQQGPFLFLKYLPICIKVAFRERSSALPLTRGVEGHGDPHPFSLRLGVGTESARAGGVRGEAGGDTVEGPVAASSGLCSPAGVRQRLLVGQSSVAISPVFVSIIKTRYKGVDQLSRTFNICLPPGRVCLAGRNLVVQQHVP